MKILRFTLISVMILMLGNMIEAQDNRSGETKIADLLARMPSADARFTNKLMADMLNLGEQGLRKICDQIVPAGTGDDTRPRFAIESLTRYLSKSAMAEGRATWEDICISYANSVTDNGVKDFFMKQLQQIGGPKSANAVKGYLNSAEMCGPALGVITAVGGKDTETILTEAIHNADLPCAAAVLNSLSIMKSDIAVNDFIRLCSSKDINTKTSALHALAVSGNQAGYDVLAAAARGSSYSWEPTCATVSFLDFADTRASKGDLKTMDKICRLIMSKCDDNANINNKLSALTIYTKYHGVSAFNELVKASSHPVKKYRTAAVMLTLGISDKSIGQKWLSYYPKATAVAKPAIITMLGRRGDKDAVPLLTGALSDSEPAVRTEAASALAKINGDKSVPAFIDYMMKFGGDTDQEAANTALMTVSGNDNLSALVPVLKSGNVPARNTVISILAWSRDNKYFSEVLPFTSSDDKSSQKAAYNALPDLAGADNIKSLIGLLSSASDKDDIAKVQSALAGAASGISDPSKRSAEILKALKGSPQKAKLIPVLASTGGAEALSTVLQEFENGNSDMREVCFNTLTSWKDNSASSALYEICASGNKTYEAPAFEGFIRQIKTSDLPDEQKLLLYRKIMPFALSAERKNEVITEIGKIKTYQALYFIAGYLDDPSTSAAAAKSAMYIALPSVSAKAGLYGSLVKDILTKAVTKLSGQESDYDREMVNKYIAALPAEDGFKPMFNGKDLTGWHGLVENPVARAKMKPAELAKKQLEADKKVPGNWSVKDGCIWFNGAGDNLCSIQDYADFEMLVDWKITKKGDSGIYLRGSPQVQIWDTSRVDVGAQVGSGGLYNNQVNMSKPLKVADNPIGDWNSFRIVMIGEKVSVWLNGILVVDNVVMENYWDRKLPIFPKGAIELQAHGTDLAFRDIYVREIKDSEYNLTAAEKSEGFVSIFYGRDLNNWTGNKKAYSAEEGMIVINPVDDSGGNLYTEKEYSDFVFRFEFQLTPAANNGIGIRAPLTGDAAYVGMEIQVLDDTAPVYAQLQPYQYHGSVYGVIPAKRGFQKPVGEWNYEEITARGSKITVVLNGTTIVDGDIAPSAANGTMDHKDHPGLKNATGHIGFLGHGSLVKFRNIRIKDLSH